MTEGRILDVLKIEDDIVYWVKGDNGDDVKIFLREAEKIDDGVEPELVGHEWQKTNLTTKKDSLGFYDCYECSICGATGTRRRLGEAVAIDYESRGKKQCTRNINSSSEA